METAIIQVRTGWVGVVYNKGLLGNTTPLPTREKALETLKETFGPITHQPASSSNPKLCFVAKLVDNLWIGDKNFYELHKKASGLTIDYSGYTSKESKVLEVVRGIKPGETLTYGEVAKMAGVARGARFVGNVLAKNRTPIIIPCHRVVAKRGPGGYTHGVGEKLRLLSLERLWVSKTVSTGC